jgi:phage baseplate assembly protein W
MMQIIGTDHHEYLLKPDFGCNIHRRVFDTLNLLPLARTDVIEALRRYEKRISNVTVKLDDSRAAEGQARLLVEYTVAGHTNKMHIDLAEFNVVSYGAGFRTGDTGEGTQVTLPTMPVRPSL